MLEEWPEDLWAGLGKDFSLLTGFLDYKAEFYADAIDELKALADDAAYVARRPELLYYLGRSYYAAAQFTQGRRRAGALRPLADRAGPRHPARRPMCAVRPPTPVRVIFSRR